MGAPEIERFLTDLAVNGHVSASTQNQAFSALLFFAVLLPSRTAKHGRPARS
jgi:hypothetical protein